MAHNFIWATKLCDQEFVWVLLPVTLSEYVFTFIINAKKTNYMPRPDSVRPPAGKLGGANS